MQESKSRSCNIVCNIRFCRSEGARLGKLQAKVACFRGSGPCKKYLSCMVLLLDAVPMSTDKAEYREAQRAAFAELFQAALRERHTNIEALSKEVPELALRTMRSWVAVGGPVIQQRQHATVEDALGWRRDSIMDILENPREAIKWGLDEVRAWEPEELPVRRASELTTDELLTELTRRVGALQAEVDRYRVPSNVAGVEGRREASVTHLGSRRRAPLSQAARTKMPDEDPKRDTE